MSILTQAVSDKEAPAAGGRERFTAFLCDEQSEQVLRQCVQDMALPFSSVRRGGIAKAIDYLKQNRSPSVLLVDVSDTDLPVSEINRLADVCEPGVSVIAIGQRNDIALYRDLRRSGVSEYLVKPVNSSLILHTLLPVFDESLKGGNPHYQRLGKVVSIMGARGGAGASTIAANLAWHLTDGQSRRLVLVDLDLQQGDVSLLLNVKAAGGLREALENPERVDDLFLERAMTRHGNHLNILSAEERLDANIRISEDALDPLLTFLRQQFHFVLLDVPNGNSALRQAAINGSQTRIIVADQSLQSLRTTVRIQQHLLTASPPGTRNLLVLNRFGERGRNGVSLDEITKTSGLKIDVKIPYHPQTVLSAAETGVPVASARGVIRQAIEQLSLELTGAQQGRKIWWKRR